MHGSESVSRADGLSLSGKGWWQSTPFILLILLLSTVPLLLPSVPPLVDLPAHIGRYRVEMELASSPNLQRYFSYEWRLIGNLGVDLLVLPLAPLIGLEPAVKLIVITVPVLTAGGFVWVARELHGEFPPSALFAIPFAYSYPFNFGFLNFALSTALAMLAFAFWLRLTRSGRYQLRAWLFVPISCLIWVAHAFGWGVLGLLAFSAELFRFRDLDCTWRQSILKAASHMLVLAVPIALMLLWRTGAPLDVSFWPDPRWKLYALISALRDRWLVWDSFGLAVVLILFWAAHRDHRLEFARRLRFLAIVLAITFLLLPYSIFGSAYADMRLAPLMLMVAILAIRSTTDDAKFQSKIAWLGLSFVILRLAGNTASFAIADGEMKERLTALNYIPEGAAVLTLARGECGDRWDTPLHSHLGGFVIARKRGFSNDQWQLNGAQLLRVNYPAAEPFQDDPSNLVYPSHCVKSFREAGMKKAIPTAEGAVRQFPRAAFDFVWLLDIPDFPIVSRPGLKLLWRGRDSALYRVEH